MRGFHFEHTILTTVIAVGVVTFSPSAGAMPSLFAAPGKPILAEPAAMGDLPTVPRRRGGRRPQAKDKPYQPLSKDPAGESAAAHKDYLKRYGF